jgi:hypothetical protein
VRVIRCPLCREPLPWTAHYCASCGQPLSSQDSPLREDDSTITFKKPLARQRPRTLRVPSFYALQDNAFDNGQPVQVARVEGDAKAIPTFNISLTDNDRIAQQRIEEWLSEAELSDEQIRRATWQKVVTRPSRAVAPPAVPIVMPIKPATPVTPVPLTMTPPATPAPLASATTPDTPVTPVSPVTPRAQSGPLLGFASPVKWHLQRPPVIPRVTTWVTAIVILALLLGGAFGIFTSLGKKSLPPALMSLEVSPSTIVSGGTISLKGTNFSPHQRVGLTRDNTIPVIDTAGKSSIQTDANGTFRDTVVIDGSWLTGPHVIHAENALLHKSASFTIMVTGNGLSPLPSHLAISTPAIDFGAGDQATDSAQTISLSNTGAGQISWQATSTQSWLMLSPTRGTFYNGQPMLVTLAVDRSSLKVGKYSAEVIFTSNAGEKHLAVSMQVTPLKPGHEAVLQVSPAVLSFTGVDGSANLTPQVVTLSNPGMRPLNWGTFASTTDGSNWLSASPASGTIEKGGSQTVTINVDSSLLLPGVYYGSISFASQGSEAVMNSPQTIYVSVTIQPQCSLAISPYALTFTSAYLQAPPARKSISVSANGSCAAPLNWSALVSTNSSAQWLMLSSTSGTTPTMPTVGVNVAGLPPGTYTGQILFSSTSGTQTIPVTLILGKATSPILTSSVGVLGVSGITGQPAPNPQIIVLSNTGAGTLYWGATASTAVGGSWLSVSPPSGTLSARQTTNLAVKAVVLPGLIPGTYNGTITLTGKDSSGHVVAGSPQTIAVTFTVQAPCSIAVSTPALTFQGVIGQPAPAAQSVAVSASGACANALSWTATGATTPAGGTWLTTAPASGTVTPKLPAKTFIGISLAGLIAGPYSGSVTISAIDSVTKAPTGSPQVITITLTVQPACMLQTPSLTSGTFSSEAGLNPAAQTFTVGVVGGCTGNVTITPTATTTSGGAWLAISPPSALVASNGTATFTITVTTTGLAAGPYTGALSLAAVDSNGITIAGSPQSIGVSLNLLALPVLSTTPATLTFTQATGSSSQSVTLQNTGGEPLTWTASLTGAPSYVTISSASTGTLAAGATTTVTVSVNATGVAGGTTATASLSISAIDPLTSKAVSGSPAVTGISISILPPAMQLSATSLTFTTTAGTNPAPQTISLSNNGGDGLTWTVGAPSQAWLTVSPGSGGDTSGTSSPLTFTVNVTGMTAGTSTATVVVTPSSGAAQTITVTLTIT